MLESLYGSASPFLCLYLCLSPSSFARGVWLLLFLLSISLYPSLGTPYPKPLPLCSSLLPEASRQKERCDLLRPLKANLNRGILCPSLAQGFKVP